MPRCDIIPVRQQRTQHNYNNRGHRAVRISPAQLVYERRLALWRLLRSDVSLSSNQQTVLSDASSSILTAPYHCPMDHQWKGAVHASCTMETPKIGWRTVLLCGNTANVNLPEMCWRTRLENVITSILAQHTYRHSDRKRENSHFI